MHGNPVGMTKTKDFHIQSDSYALPAQLRTPEGGPKSAYVLHCATGVPAAYYSKFADWVADQGHAILTYDYREDTDVKSSEITMADWGIHDQNAALNTLISLFPDTEIRVIGHSLGGLTTAFHENAGCITSFTAACSGPAYWRRAPFPANLIAFMFWYIWGPLGIALTGSVPARLLGTPKPIEKYAFRQWRDWCCNRYLHKPDWGKSVPHPKMETVTAHLNLVSVSDDTLVPPHCVADLADFYPHASSSHETVTPAMAGTTKIGHLAIFRPKCATLWPKLL
jgi:predicted alpha/beta hydrolase